MRPTLADCGCSCLRPPRMSPSASASISSVSTSRLGDGGGARTLLAEVREILARMPRHGDARRRDGRARANGSRQIRGGVVGASTLTLAELRLLPLLTTHLSFREIGERLYVSQNTVKTQAISIYRKLDATSRSEAVARATEMGLLDGPVGEAASRGG